jgi:hypothetical protein
LRIWLMTSMGPWVATTPAKAAAKIQNITSPKPTMPMGLSKSLP